jgi:uncharacterized membrane protein
MDKYFKLKTKHYLYLAFIGALVLRLFNLNYEGLWNDELFTADTANPANSLGHIIFLLKLDIHPPLHNLLSYFWSHIFSYNDTSLRVFNVVLGLGGLLSLYHLGKLLFNKKIALYAVLLATVNFFLIRYSQEVRSYGLLFLLSNYSFYFFIKLIRGEMNAKNSIGYVLITTALLYTHYFGMFVMASQFAASFVIINWATVKRQFWKYLITFVGPLLLFSFWFPILKVHLERKTKSWRDTPSLDMVYTYSQEFFNDYALAFIASTLVLLSGVFLILRKFRKIKSVDKLVKKDSQVLAVLVIWTAVYFMIPYLKSSWSTSMMVTRYFIVMLAPILLIMAFYLSKINGMKLRNGILATVLGYSLLLLFLNDKPYYTQTTSYREIAEEAKMINNDAPVLFLSNNGRYFRYYLAQNNFTQLRANIDPFTKVIHKHDPVEYFVFLDLRPVPRRYKDDIPVVDGYQEVDSKTFKNKRNIKTARLIRYRKVKNSL